jgi:hypothetical protein
MSESWIQRTMSNTVQFPSNVKYGLCYERREPKRNSSYNFAFRSPIQNFVKIRPGTFGDTTYEHVDTSKIWGFHGGHYDDYHLLGDDNHHVDTTSPLWVHFMCFMLRTQYQACLFNYAVDWIQYQRLMPRLPVNPFSLYALNCLLLSIYGVKHVALYYQYGYFLPHCPQPATSLHAVLHRAAGHQALWSLRKRALPFSESVETNGWNARQPLQFLRQAFRGSITYSLPAVCGTEEAGDRSEWAKYRSCGNHDREGRVIKSGQRV